MWPAQDKSKPVLLSMARLDHVKNLTGLAEWFARNKRLRQLCNLVIVGGIVDPSQTTGMPTAAMHAVPLDVVMGPQEV